MIAEVSSSKVRPLSELILHCFTHRTDNLEGNRIARILKDCTSLGPSLCYSLAACRQGRRRRASHRAIRFACVFSRQGQAFTVVLSRGRMGSLVVHYDIKDKGCPVLRPFIKSLRHPCCDICIALRSAFNSLQVFLYVSCLIFIRPVTEQTHFLEVLLKIRTAPHSLRNLYE